MSTFADSDDSDEFQHDAACIGKKTDIQTKECNIFFENYNLIPQDMYKGLSQVYCDKPEGIIH